MSSKFVWWVYLGDQVSSCTDNYYYYHRLNAFVIILSQDIHCLFFLKNVHFKFSRNRCLCALLKCRVHQLLNLSGFATLLYLVLIRQPIHMVYNSVLTMHCVNGKIQGFSLLPWLHV